MKSLCKKIALFSDELRRDACFAQQYFKSFKTVNFYKKKSLDLRQEDLNKEYVVPYRSLLDLFIKLICFKPDIIQAYEPCSSKEGFKLAIASFFYAFLFRKPLFFPMFENRPLHVRYGKLAILFRFVLRLLANYAKLIIVLNEGARRTLLDLKISESKIVKQLWGTWGVDLCEFKPLPKVKKIVPPQLLFIGRIEEFKGVRYLLEAYELLLKNGYVFSLAYAGWGKIQKELENYVKKRKFSLVKFLGPIKNSDLPVLINQSFAVVSPSITVSFWEEQVGMVNIQAMACGVPVISTLSGAIPEYVEDGRTGILVPEKDSEAIAEAVIKIYNDKALYERISKLARKEAVQRFDARKNVLLGESLLKAKLGIKD